MNSHFVIPKDSVVKWAEFSGDWNPIHFDPEASLRVGIRDPFAHGMLSLLFLKQYILSRRLNQSNTTGWISLDFRMRSPVFCDRQLEIKGPEVQGDAHHYTMLDSVSQSPLIYARVVECCRPNFPVDGESEVVKLPGLQAHVVEKFNAINGTNSVPHFITFEEALAFSVILNKRGHANDFDIVREHLTASEAGKHQFSVLHTRHILHINLSSIGALPPAWEERDISFSAAPPLRQPDGFSTSVNFSVNLGVEKILQSEAFVKIKRSIPVPV